MFQCFLLKGLVCTGIKHEQCIYCLACYFVVFLSHVQIACTHCHLYHCFTNKHQVLG